MPKGRKEAVQAHAEARGESVNGFINRAIAETMERDNAVPDPADSPEAGLNGADAEFIARAVEMVERNLNTPAYSVEQLSRDLCMERTGLYKKLMAILDKSPQMFIRSIRLRKAAELLARGGMAVGEVSEVTGFSSPSYFTKCFQKEYGCRPTEYQPDKNTCI